MSQGGVIGKPNDPNTEDASGVWKLDELFRARVGGNWPVGSRALIETIYRVAKNDVAGRVINYTPPIEDDPEIGPGLLTEVEVFHYSLDTYPAGLNLTSGLVVGEDAPKPQRVTAVVVDGPLTFGAGGSISVTNDQSRLALAVFSRDDIDVGDGRNIIQPPFTYVEEPGATTDFRDYILTFGAPETDRTLKSGGSGGAGNVGTGDGGTSGAGGVAFGGQSAVWPRSATGTAGAPGQNAPFSGGGGAGGGGSPFGSGGSSGSPPRDGNPGFLPAGTSVFLVGRDITIPPNGVIDTSGGDGGASRPGAPPVFGNVGASGGGAGGHPIAIYHVGSFVNNGTLNASGGAAGSSPEPLAGSVPGGAGEITVAPIPSNVVQQ